MVVSLTPAWACAEAAEGRLAPLRQGAAAAAASRFAGRASERAALVPARGLWASPASSPPPASQPAALPCAMGRRRGGLGSTTRSSSRRSSSLRAGSGRPLGCRRRASGERAAGGRSQAQSGGPPSALRQAGRRLRKAGAAAAPLR